MKNSNHLNMMPKFSFNDDFFNHYLPKILKPKLLRNLIYLLCFIPSDQRIEAQLTSMPILAGVSANIEFHNAYTLEQNTYYLYPDGFSKSNLTDLDRAYMVDYQSRIRYYDGMDADSNVIIVHHILDPDKEFQPWQQKVSHIVFQNGKMTTYGLNGQVLRIKSFEPELSEKDPYDGNEMKETILPNGKIEYSSENILIEIDSLSLTRFSKISLPSGNTEIAEFFDLDYIGEWRRNMQIVTTPITTPSGLCMYQVAEYLFQDYTITQEPLEPAKTTPFGVATLRQELTISPNPARDFIDIEFNKSVLNSDNQIQILDFSGKLLLDRRNVPSSSLRIATSSYVSGIYFVRIKNGDQYEVKKLIIQ